MGTVERVACIDEPIIETKLFRDPDTMKKVAKSLGNHRMVVVTGTSSGIGRAIAYKLIGMGFRVIAGVRTEKAIDAWNNEKLPGLTPVLLDVTDEGSIESTLGAVNARIENYGFAGIVNNAGCLASGPMEFVPREVLKQHFEINCMGTVAMIQAFLPLLRFHHGRIVNIGSTSGRVVSAFQGPYCASKFALKAVTDTLRLELNDSGVEISIVEPGVVRTPLWEKGIDHLDALMRTMPTMGIRLYGQQLADRRSLFEKLKSSGMPPEKVAEAVGLALTDKHPRSCYIVGWSARLHLFASAILSRDLRQRLSELRRLASRKTSAADR